jgi:hypothetical protein
MRIVSIFCEFEAEAPVTGTVMKSAAADKIDSFRQERVPSAFIQPFIFSGRVSLEARFAHLSGTAIPPAKLLGSARMRSPAALRR